MYKDMYENLIGRGQSIFNMIQFIIWTYFTFTVINKCLFTIKYFYITNIQKGQKGYHC